MHDLNAEIELYDATEGTNAQGVCVSEAQPANASVAKYGDADVRVPYNERDYSKTITIAVGSNKQAKRWHNERMPAGAMNARLCKHVEGAKDGPAFVLGDMVPGQRLKTAVVALHGVGLDIDVGTPSAVVDAALAKLGCLAVRYTTHSHGKTKSEIKKDKVVKFAAGREIDEALIQQFLLEIEQWDCSIVDNAEYKGTEHTERGIVCVISHPPMPKHRVVVLFAEPFVIENEAPTQAEAMRKWAKVPEALAHLLGVPFDTSCTDPSRLFYFPRHAKGKPFEISLFGGPYFDWRTLELENPLDRMVADLGKGKSKSVSDEGRALGRWSLKRSHGFQIADLIQDQASDRIRHDTGHGLEIQCPFDEDHSNAGDPEDRACLAVNAGEGPSEWFTISCRHETCRNKTNLDMLAKCIKDGWFEKDALESENYNAILEDDQKPAVAVAIEKQDDARAAYQKAIDTLSSTSTQDQIDAAVLSVIKANLRKAARAQAEKAIAKATGLSIGTVRETFKEVFESETLTAPPEKEPDASDKSPRTEIVVSDGYGGALAFQNVQGAIPKGVTYDKETQTIYPTYRNALLLIGSEKWDLGYNELTQRHGLRGEVDYPWPEHLGYALNDAIRREIRLYMLRRWGVTFKMDDVYEATMTLAQRNTFNPVRDYLDEVEARWDGHSRVDTWLERYMGVAAKDSDFEAGHAAYVRAIAKIVLVAAVRRARQVGCKFDELLLLEGPQGGGKSTAIGILGGEWYSDAKLGDLSNTQKVGMKLRGTWIHEFGELIGLTKAEVEEVKDFLSKLADRYKQPYGRSEDDYPRCCIFIGSINPGGSAYLTDLTGNRRMWPVTCGDIDLEALARDRDMLWAEAAMMESRGDSIRLDPSLYAAAKAEQAARLADEPWVAILAEYLDRKLADDVTRVTSVKLLGDALGLYPEKQTQAAMKKLKGAMALIPSWTYKPTLRADGLRTAGYEYAPPS
jgi:hypothetical protein